MGKISNFIKKLRTLLNVDFEEFKENQRLLSEKVDSLENGINKKLDDITNAVSGINNEINRNNAFNYTNPEIIEVLLNKTEKKKVLICGFYGAFNLGDELMLETLLNNIPNKDQLDITIMLSDNKHSDITKYGKYHFIHYPKTILDLNYLADYFDVLIFGGGALLDDENYDVVEPQMTLGRLLVNLSMRFITFDKTTILYGLSSNKRITNKEFIQKLDYIANNATHFSLRDENSLNTLKDAGIHTEKIKIVDDIAFANEYPSFKENKGDTINVGLIYICFDDKKESLVAYTKKIISYLESKNQKYNLNLIPFYNYCDRDKVFYENLKEEIGNENITVCDFKYTFKEITELLNEQDLIISMRYHGSLLANMLNKKTITILLEHRHYENKMFYLHDNYGFKKTIVDKIDDGILDEVLNNKIDRQDTLQIANKAKKELEDALKLI